MNYLVIGLFVYAIGYFISLIAMHKYKNELDLNNYDPPHEGYYDDYESNAVAYAAISFAWPIFWTAMLFVVFWRGLVAISKKLDTKWK